MPDPYDPFKQLCLDYRGPIVLDPKCCWGVHDYKRQSVSQMLIPRRGIIVFLFLNSVANIPLLICISKRSVLSSL